MDIEPLIDALLIQKMSRRKSLSHLSEECLGVTSEIKSRGYSGISGCLLASRKPMQELPKAAIRSEGPSKKSNTATGYRCQLCRYKDKVVFQSLASSTQVSTLKPLGVPVEYAQPKEGAVVLNVAECTIAHNNQPALAQKLAAYLLSPEAQAPGTGRWRSDSFEPEDADFG